MYEISILLVDGVTAFLLVFSFILGCFGWDVAQLLGQLTEKSSTMLMQVLLPGAARDFSPCHLSVPTLTVFVQPLCTVACVIICAHIRNPQYQ